MHARYLPPLTLAHYNDMASARRAIEALQNRGIDSRDIDLIGPAAERAARHADNDVVSAGVDGGIALHLILRAVPWGVLGAALGGCFGAVIAATVGTGPLGTNFGVQVLTYGTGGLIVGALVAAMTAISQGEAWELTFEPGAQREDPVGVVVHDSDPAVVERAAQILRHKDADRVEVIRA